jgi:hypothetical protein
MIMASRKTFGLLLFVIFCASRVGVANAAGGAGAGAAGAANAAGAAPPTAAEKETARRLMDEGKTRLKVNDNVRAIDAFQKANDIMHVPTTGLALAKAHLAAGHLVEARDAALEVGRLPHDPGESAVLEAARKQAKELEAQLKPRIPMLRIRIHGATPTHVAVDDAEIPMSIIGEPVAVNPGKRTVTAKSAEGGEVKGDIELAEREVREIELTLPARGDGTKAAPPPTGTSSGDKTTSKVEVGPPSGTSDDRDKGLVRTQLAEGLMYGGAIGGALGITVGIITGALTLSKAHAVQPQCDNNICAPDAKDDLDTALTFGTISTIGFVVGLVGVAAGVVGYMLPKKPPKARPRESRREVFHTFAIGPGGLGGSFW